MNLQSSYVPRLYLYYIWLLYDTCGGNVQLAKLIGEKIEINSVQRLAIGSLFFFFVI